MSVSTLNNSMRLSDSMERDLMISMLSNGESTSITSLAKSVVAVLKSGIVTVWEYTIEVSEAMNEARAKDARFTGSQW
ncbi:hypothetical protein [Pusillimonas sp. ANT_WB101]|uniref:hypothetical protein n=1 Tax=Pusillimonas sp. ANT_WB101 TaxID=2597356 RepID=UPI0011EFEE21|nr:hypothetical protein [Pusillimonas sp. ANT_WB101]KAA0889374.1 hypothetical protein FQ179_19650 [Pusillimonas sp. ANT_WB101]